MTDAWHPTITADLRRLEAALHDIIDIPPPDTHAGNLYVPDNSKDGKAAKLEQAAHRCTNPKKCTGDADCHWQTDAVYTAVSDPQVRRTGPSDPTGRQAERWANRIVHETSKLVTFTAAWHREAKGAVADLDSHAVRHNTSVPDMPHAETWVDHRGREQVAVGPSTAGRMVRYHIGHAQVCADVIRDCWTLYPYDDMTFTIRADDLRHRTKRALARLRRLENRPEPARQPCVNPHGLTRHPVGPNGADGICVRCREDGWCGTCGVRQPATYVNADGEERDRSECWSCIGKAKRARQEQNA